MLVNERRSIHEYQMQIEDYKRSNEDLKAEAGRHKLRVESKSFDACQFLINLIHLCQLKIGYFRKYIETSENVGTCDKGTQCTEDIKTCDS